MDGCWTNAMLLLYSCEHAIAYDNNLLANTNASDKNGH